MASVRRSKSLTPDGQTAKFLYSILKQLDLKAVDWTQVAEAIGITNGHAARMRYSRFKSQIEGAPAYAKKEKAKKSDCKDKFSDNYDYGKRKREEESQMSGQESKIMKVEPCFHPQWPYAFPTYGHPMPMQYYQQQMTLPQQMPHMPSIQIKDEPPSQPEGIAEPRPSADGMLQQTPLNIQTTELASQQPTASIHGDEHTGLLPTSPKTSEDAVQANNQCEKAEVKKEPETEILPIEVIDEEQPIWRPSTPDSILNLLPLISPSMFASEAVSNDQDKPVLTSSTPSDNTPASVAALEPPVAETAAPMATTLTLNTTEPPTSLFSLLFPNQAPSAPSGFPYAHNYRLPSPYGSTHSARGYWQQGPQSMYAQNHQSYPGQRSTYAATPRMFGYQNAGQQPLFYPPSPYNYSNPTVSNDGTTQKHV